MSSHLRILSPGAVPMVLAVKLFVVRFDLVSALVIMGTLLLLILLQQRSGKQARERQAKQHVFGKRVSEFAERLAVSPLERVDTAIVEGLKSICLLYTSPSPRD